jgi:hypothetical protein
MFHVMHLIFVYLVSTNISPPSYFYSLLKDCFRGMCYSGDAIFSFMARTAKFVSDEKIAGQDLRLACAIVH